MDTVEVAVVPVLLGAGIPLLPPGATQELVLGDHQIPPASGIIALSYSVSGAPAAAPPIRYVKPPKNRTKARTEPEDAPAKGGGSE